MNEKILLEALDCLDPALLDRTFLQGEKIAKRRRNLPRPLFRRSQLRFP